MGLRWGQGPGVNQKGGRGEPDKAEAEKKGACGVTHRLDRAGHRALLSGPATILLCVLKLPFSLDRVGPGVGLGELPTWGIPVPIVLGPFPRSLPHCPASAPPRYTK